MNTKTMNLIKKKNIDLLRDEMKRIKTATKPQLAELTGISLVTVNSLIKNLVESKEVLEDTVVQPQLGRPAVTYKYNAEYKLALLIFTHEIDGEDIANFIVINLYGEKIAVYKKFLGEISIESFDSSIEEILLIYDNIEVIGFGLPAQEVNGRLSVSDYDNLRNVEFCSYIQVRFNKPVFIENDINAATVGYCCTNVQTKDECIIGLYFPSKYAPGAGIYRNGELIKGRDGLAGEIKYLPLNIDWEHFDYLEATVNQIVLKVIRIFMCLYNPDKIVIYKENVRYDFTSELEKICISSVEKILLPSIVISNNLNSDFENGMICLALEKLKIV